MHRYYLSSMCLSHPFPPHVPYPNLIAFFPISITFIDLRHNYHSFSSSFVFCFLPLGVRCFTHHPWYCIYLLRTWRPATSSQSLSLIIKKKFQNILVIFQFCFVVSCVYNLWREGYLFSLHQFRPLHIIY